MGSDYTNINRILAAPNSNDDLLVAGTYIEQSDFDFKLFAYLFRSSTCSYSWAFTFGNEPSEILVHLRGLAWSLDETKAYMLTTKVLDFPAYEYLTVFSDPYDELYPYRGDLSPITYSIPKINVNIQNLLWF